VIQFNRSREKWHEILNGITDGFRGGKRACYDAGHEQINAMRLMGAWKPSDRIIDVGCGNGRLAIPLTEFDVGYLGIEVVRESVEFCKRAFEPWPHLRFSHIDVRTSNSPDGSIAPTDVVFPVDDN